MTGEYSNHSCCAAASHFKPFCCRYRTVAISPIPLISTFGYAAAFQILCNYVLVISFFPACIGTSTTV